jgi:hypothetical protein
VIGLRLQGLREALSLPFFYNLFNLLGLKLAPMGHPPPPAQTRTCSFSASGSSVVLASAQTTLAVCLLLPTVRLA